jgi:hypothetical protein
MLCRALCSTLCSASCIVACCEACCVLHSVPPPPPPTTTTTTIFLPQSGMYPSSSAEQSTLLNACWEEYEDPSPQHGTNGVQCQQSRQDQGAKSSARQLVCLSAHLLINLLVKGNTLLDACWEEDEDPSPQHGTNGVQCQQSHKTREPNHLLIGSSARWFGLLHSSTNGGHPCIFFFTCSFS